MLFYENKAEFVTFEVNCGGGSNMEDLTSSGKPQLLFVTDIKDSAEPGVRQAYITDISDRQPELDTRPNLNKNDEMFISQSEKKWGKQNQRGRKNIWS